jgi:hypothetical protein
LTFKHLGFVWHLDFVIWYLMDITPCVPLILRGRCKGSPYFKGEVGGRRRFWHLSIWGLFGIWCLEFGIYLAFGFWNLGGRGGGASTIFLLQMGD